MGHGLEEHDDRSTRESVDDAADRRPLAVVGCVDRVGPGLAVSSLSSRHRDGPKSAANPTSVNTVARTFDSAAVKGHSTQPRHFAHND